MSAIVMSGEENVLHHTATQPGSTDGQPGPVDDLGVINRHRQNTHAHSVTPAKPRHAAAV